MHDVSRPNEFERSDADPRLIGALAMGVAVFLLGVPFLVSMSYPHARHLGRIPDNLPQPPPPRLQVAPQVDLDRLHADETKQLSTYGWVDGSKGVTRIPIERAMRLLSERGRPGWPSSGPPSASQPPQ
jgi:hypothetical protein